MLDFSRDKWSICTAHYIDENNESINILRLSDYAIKRMTKLNITLDIEEVLNAVNAGIKPNVITGEDWTEVSYN